MEFLANYGLFLAKAVTIVICIGVLIGFIVAASQRNTKSSHGHIEVTKINERFEDMEHTLKSAVLDAEESKQLIKDEKKKAKAEKAEKKKALKRSKSKTEPLAEEARRKRVYVLNFHGDIKASAADDLREEVSTVLSVAESDDEVLVRLESTGGMVHSYGLAASQLQRVKNKQIPLTICVDKVAASGGYMMACVADKILAAPFAIIGSIGVIGQLPNFHRLLQKIPVDYEMQTAGEFKRTLTLFGENTDKARQKFSEELEDTHLLFKEFIRENRADLDVDSVATGETWYGRRAIERKLIDEIKTSDEYLLDLSQSADLFEVEYKHKKSLPEKIGLSMQHALDRVLLTWLERLQASRFFS